MTTTRMRMGLAALAAAAGLVAGCENGPPGGGITNGSAPDLTADKAAIRTDGETRNRTDQGEMKGAGGMAGSMTGAGEKDSGSGGKSGNSGENSPAKGPAPVADGAGAPKSSGSAAGATKPQGDIKVGTPKGPQ